MLNGPEPFCIFTGQRLKRSWSSLAPAGFRDLICADLVIPCVTHRSDLMGPVSPSFQYRDVPF